MGTQWITGMIVGYLTWHGYSVGHWDDSRLFNLAWVLRVTGMIVGYLTWHGYSVDHWDDCRLYNLAWVLSGSLG